MSAQKGAVYKPQQSPKNNVVDLRITMGRRANISQEKRAQIYALHQAGFSVRNIARRVNCGKSAVQTAIQRYEESGSNRDRPRSGRPRVSSARDDAYLIQIARRRRQLTARMMQEEWQPAIGHRVAIQTIRNRSVAS